MFSKTAVPIYPRKLFNLILLNLHLQLRNYSQYLYSSLSTNGVTQKLSSLLHPTQCTRWHLLRSYVFTFKHTNHDMLRDSPKKATAVTNEGCHNIWSERGHKSCRVYPCWQPRWLNNTSTSVSTNCTNQRAQRLPAASDSPNDSPGGFSPDAADALSGQHAPWTQGFHLLCNLRKDFTQTYGNYGL